MAFRAYSGPPGTQAVSPLDKEKLLYKEFDSLDAALGWARHVIKQGRVALMIEGDDGTMMNMQEISAVVRHPETAGLSGS